mmetsp:Transcript_5653/g.18086  ORF Transcript_5653/g.18086 Transcript_5653/m.18086 type:complete len:311 (+) Transcript_5653:1036-1968(+)
MEALGCVRQGRVGHRHQAPVPALGLRHLLRAGCRPDLGQVLHSARRLLGRHRVVRLPLLRHLAGGGQGHGPHSAERPGGLLRGPPGRRLVEEAAADEARQHRLLRRPGQERVELDPQGHRGGLRGLEQRERHHLKPLQLLHESEGRKHDHRHRVLGLARLHPHGQAVPPAQRVRRVRGRHRLRRQPEHEPLHLHRRLRRRHALPHRPLLHLQLLRGRVHARRGHGRRRHQAQDLRAGGGRLRPHGREPGEPGRQERLADGTERALPGAVQPRRHQGGQVQAARDRHHGVPRDGHIAGRPHRDRGLPEGHG